jgi:hypothetical protein
MYLHLGKQVAVPFKNVIGIFDLDNSSVSKHTRRYLEEAQKNGRVVNVSEELPRSFIICNEEGKTLVYISQISSQTLLKRAESNSYAEEQ